MSSSKQMTISQFPKYWDAVVKELKELTARVAQLEAKDQATPAPKKEVEPE